MKLIHLADLHLGRRVNAFSMLDDQAYILDEIFGIIAGEEPDGVLIAGDVYDKAVPPAEAVRLFDDFLVRLSRLGLQVFVISGNHDSADRIAFGGRLMDLSGIHMSPVYDGQVRPFYMRDAYGTAAVWLLPFLKPAHVRACFPEEEIISYTDALSAAVAHMDVDPALRNVLVTHQFVTGAERSESEEIAVGGSDNVDASAFSPFDYVALGHLHRPQKAGGARIRYAGSPLKYSFSEKDHIKSVTVAELKEKGSLEIRTVPLTPLHDLRELRGTYEQLTLKANWAGTAADDYLHIVLTDEEDVPDAMARLRTIYPNLMKLDYDNARTRASAEWTPDPETDRKTETEWFEMFYEKQNGRPMTPEQRRYAGQLFEKLKEAGL